MLFGAFLGWGGRGGGGGRGKLARPSHQMSLEKTLGTKDPREQYGPNRSVCWTRCSLDTGGATISVGRCWFSKTPRAYCFSLCACLPHHITGPPVTANCQPLTHAPLLVCGPRGTPKHCSTVRIDDGAEGGPNVVPRGPASYTTTKQTSPRPLAHRAMRLRTKAAADRSMKMRYRNVLVCLRLGVMCPVIFDHPPPPANNVAWV